MSAYGFARVYAIFVYAVLVYSAHVRWRRRTQR